MKKSLISLLLAVTLLISAFFTAVPAVATQENEIKNVILMIGDGMGPNHLNWTKAECNVALCMDTFPIQGYSITDSLSGLTDSAAGGTALSSGKHCFNSNIATLSITMGDGGCKLLDFKTVAEVAKDCGMKAGVLTSDSNTGATPASFTAHVPSRSMEKEITDQQLKSNFDLIWSEDCGYVSEQAAKENGWQYVTKFYDVPSLKEGVPSFGQFNHVCYDDGGKSTSTLSTLTDLAIDQLNNDNGFFLMVEGAHIDKYSHNNEKEGMMQSLIEFDKSVRTAVDFAKEDGHTVVIVTADHETGGITLDSKTGTYSFTTGSHTRANVPLRIFGAEGLTENGKAVENCEVAKFIASAISGTELPVTVFNKNFVSDFFRAFIDMVRGWFN